MQVNVRVKTFKPLIPDKWGGLIWAVMFVAGLIRNVVPLADSFTGLSGVTEIIVQVIYCLLEYGALPMVVCYVFSLVLFTMSARRRAVALRRNDFIYFCMLFTSGAYLLMGIIESFSFLDAGVYVYTSQLLNMTVLTGAYCAMFFLVLAPKMDPRQKYYNFSSWASLYLGLQGLLTVVTSVSYIILFYDEAFNEQLMEIMEAYYGMQLAITENYAIAGIIALCLLTAWCVAAGVVAFMLQKKAKSYVPPAPQVSPFAPPRQPSSPFDEFNGGGNAGGADGTVGGDADKSGDSGKVFDEFDL